MSKENPTKEDELDWTKEEEEEEPPKKKRKLLFNKTPFDLTLDSPEDSQIL